MKIVAQEKKNSKRYLPHTVSTKEGAVKLYRQTKDVDFVLRRYHISKASLMRWNRLYDGTKESLTPKSHRPHSQHPKAHTEEELGWIAATTITALTSYTASPVKRWAAADTHGQNTFNPVYTDCPIDSEYRQSHFRCRYLR